MYSFVDKYHFKNYIRKICYSIGISKEDFEKYYAETLFTLYDFDLKLGWYLSFYDFQLCNHIAYEIKKLNKRDNQYLKHILSNDYERLKNELKEISFILSQNTNNSQEVEKHQSIIYGVDITKYRILYRSILEHNKFLVIFKGDSAISEKFIEFAKENEMKFGLYFLYNSEKELIYIGKSINLGNRIINSIRERGALFVSLAYTKSKSDMHIYEPYYILKEKPLLNTEFQETDKLNIKLRKLKKTELINIYKNKSNNNNR